MAPANGTTPRRNLKTTGDDAALVQLARFIETKRAQAKDNTERATGEFRKYAQSFAKQELKHWSAMTAEKLKEQRESEQAKTNRREQHKRQEAWKQLIAVRGRRYERCTLENFQAEVQGQRQVLQDLRNYAKRMRENVADGQGILLFGPSGTGKDHLQTAMMRAAITTGLSVEWRSGPALWSELRDRIGSDRSENDLLRPLMRADVLAISDPSAQAAPLTEYQAATLYRIVDERYNRQRPIWLTANVASRRELEELLSVPIVDRLIDSAIVLGCDWPSYRKPQGMRQAKRLENRPAGVVACQP